MADPKKPSNSMPTLAQVARLAGVGLGTASRAISGQGYVSESAAKRIRAAAELLGFQRNELARSLAMGRSGTVGLVFPDIGGPFMVSCVRAIQKVLRQNEYTSIIAFTDGRDEVEAEEISYLVRHQIDGLIIVPSLSDAPHFQSSQLARIPVVAFDQPVTNESYDAVLVKNRHSARVAVQHLIEHGHKRIACIGMNGHLYSIQKRIAGYRDAMKQAELHEQLEIVDPENDGIARQLDRWLTSRTPPTAIFSLNELTTVELTKAFSMRGIRLPQQLAFVSFDDIQLGAYLDPPITAVLQPATDIGTYTATRILERINSKTSLPPRRILLDAQLVIRRSCGCS